MSATVLVANFELMQQKETGMLNLTTTQREWLSTLKVLAQVRIVTLSSSHEMLIGHRHSFCSALYVDEFAPQAKAAKHEELVPVGRVSSGLQSGVSSTFCRGCGTISHNLRCGGSRSW